MINSHRRRYIIEGSAECTDNSFLVVASAVDLGAAQLPTPCRTCSDDRKKLIECDMVQSYFFQPFQLESQPLGPGTTPPINVWRSLPKSAPPLW